MDRKNNYYLYHGSNTVIKQINLSFSRLRTDFGKGFYLSDKLDVAQVWAQRAAGLYGVAHVMRFEVNKGVFLSTQVVCKRFEGATKEWLDFVSSAFTRKNLSDFLS